MGIGIVLLFWAVAGTILAAMGMLALGGATALFTRGVVRGRRTVIIVAGLFPFACLAWAGALFMFQAFVNEGVLHRDPGLGDTWHCPLPNGYALMMIDVTDQGWVYNPKTQAVAGGVGEQEDAASGVRLVQVTGRFILGASDSQSFQHLGQSRDDVDSYFLLDTQTGKRTTFSTYDALHAAARQLGIQLELEPINSVYSRYRFTWFDVFIGFVLCAPPLLAALLLIRWIARLRGTLATSPQPA
jgi:hypothetical protein